MTNRSNSSNEKLLLVGEVATKLYDAESLSRQLIQNADLEACPTLLLLRCIFFAICSFPVPLSPMISTDIFVEATSLPEYDLCRTSATRRRFLFLRVSIFIFMLFCSIKTEIIHNFLDKISPMKLFIATPLMDLYDSLFYRP